MQTQTELANNRGILQSGTERSQNSATKYGKIAECSDQARKNREMLRSGTEKSWNSPIRHGKIAEFVVKARKDCEIFYYARKNQIPSTRFRKNSEIHRSGAQKLQTLSKKKTANIAKQ